MEDAPDNDYANEIDGIKRELLKLTKAVNRMTTLNDNIYEISMKLQAKIDIRLSNNFVEPSTTATTPELNQLHFKDYFGLPLTCLEDLNALQVRLQNNLDFTAELVTYLLLFISYIFLFYF